MLRSNRIRSSIFKRLGTQAPGPVASNVRKKGLLFNFSLRHCSTLSPSKVLVLANHDNHILKPDTLSAINAASLLSDDITVLVAGSGEGLASVASTASKLTGVKSVISVNKPDLSKFGAECWSRLTLNVHEKYSFSHIIAPSNATFKNILPRIGAKLDIVTISDVMEIVDGSTFKRPTYAGNAICTLRSKSAVKLMSIRCSNFEKAAESGLTAPISEADIACSEECASEWVHDEITKSERPELGAARIVISGGRGMKNGENFSMLYELADQLGGAVGASRAAVDAGFIPNDMQVGQTGKIVAPDLYVAVGISGAIQHLAGMKDSKVIVAINKDKEAPIFQVADYGLVADLFTALPQLKSALNRQ